MSGPTFATVALAALGLAGAIPSPLDGQVEEMVHFGNHRHVGLGYVVNAPHIFVGFNVLALQAGGFGVYADVKLSVDSPKDEQSCCPYTVADAEGFGDQLFQEKSDWRSFNVALARVVAPQLAVYGGAGASRERAYRQYFDQTRTRGSLGAYWVEDNGASGTRLNLLGGLLFHASRNLVFVFGGELEPPGVTVGLTLAVPR